MQSCSSYPFLIPLFIPHKGCRHQCAFCNQVAITGNSATLPESHVIENEIRRFLNYRRAHHSMVQIAFYGGNFLGLDTDDIRRLLKTAARFVHSGMANSIRFSTRPDTIDQERLSLIRDYPVSTIEIGAQSMDDRVLEKSARGHRAQDSIHAVQLLKEFSYEIGVQMMIGLPGDSEETALATGHRIASLSPDFVRIYPTLVIDRSPLAHAFKRGSYRPLSLDESVQWTKRLYLHFQNHHIRVIRMGLQADASLEKEGAIIAGPYHPAFGQMVHSAIFLENAIEMIEENKLYTQGDPLAIYVHPSQISTMRGQKNANVKTLFKRFGAHVRVIPDPTLERDQLRITDCSRNEKLSP